MSTELWDGDIFAGKYRVDKVLGQGGMGMVLGAHHLGLDEPVAIKVLLPTMLEIPGMVDRFLREARAAAKIKNEHVARVTDVDTLPSGVPYIVMERLEGLDLAALCTQKKLGVEESVRYVLEACEAIAEAHEIGIIHRDLKPGNIFLARRRDGSSTIKVLDFGISKLTGVLAQHQATTVGTVLGSPSYMSPEQMASAPDVDGRTDIWALGVILYQLTTGELPFYGDTLPQLCMRVLQATPQRPREIRADLPPQLEALILRCLEKDREPRFSTVRELMEALRPFSVPGAASITGAIPEAEPTTPSQPSQPTIAIVPTQRLSDSIVSSAVTILRPRTRQRSRRPFLLVASGSLTLLLVGGIAVALRSSASPTTPDRSGSDRTTATIASELVQAPPPSPSLPIPLLEASSNAPSATAPPATSAMEKPAPQLSPETTKKPPSSKPSVKPTNPPPDDPFGGSQK